VNHDLVNEESNELDSFLTLLDADAIDKLVLSINDYAAYRIEYNTPARRRCIFRDWKPVTSYELYKFFAVTAMMGIDPFIRDYWSIHQGLYTPWYSKMFQRERFEAMYHSFLHACEVDAENKCKIKPFINSLVENFSKAFTPGQHVAIDEMIVGFKGRWAYKHFNASKPHKYHIKSFGLVDSGTGYVCNVLTYYGSNTSYHHSIDKDGGMAIKIFGTLLNGLGREYHIFADRWYTTKALLDFLQKEKYTTSQELFRLTELDSQRRYKI
jgi:Transposase IS4